MLDTLRRGLVTAAAALSVALIPSPSGAVLIPTTDFNAAFQTTIGGAVTGVVTNPIVGPGETLGILSGQVFMSAGTYTYVLTVTPSVHNISLFGTSFAATGFNPLVHRAGYDVAEAFNAFSPLNQGTVTALGRAGNPLDVIFNNSSDLHIQWRSPENDETGEITPWGIGTDRPVTFFWQSTYGPGLNTFAIHNLINSVPGSAASWAPALPPTLPEPSTLLLLGSGLAVVGVLGWRRKKR